MQRYSRLELSVGLFVVLGGLALGYLALSLGGVTLGEARYAIHARFSSVGDLKPGDAVKLAGVTVGEVSEIKLVDYTAAVALSLSRAVSVPMDTIASIQTAGLLGDAFVSLSPGAAAEYLPAGGSIRRTEPAISISELLAKYAFGSSSTSGQGVPNDGAGAPPMDLLQ